MKKTAGVSILVVGLSLVAWRTPADEPRVQDPVLPAPPAQPPRPAPNIELPPGFVAELVYEVPEANGSWVALTSCSLYGGNALMPGPLLPPV